MYLPYITPDTTVMRWCNHSLKAAQKGQEEARGYFYVKRVWEGTGMKAGPG